MSAPITDLPIETIDKLFNKDILLKDFVNKVVKEYEGEFKIIDIKNHFKELKEKSKVITFEEYLTDVQSKNSFGQSGLWRYVRDNSKVKYLKRDVDKWYNSKYGQVHQARPIKKFQNFIFQYPHEQHFADLMDTPHDKGFKYLLNVVDGYTRYAWSIPLKDKTARSIFDALQNLYSTISIRPQYFHVDNGTEFNNEPVKRLLKYSCITMKFHGPDILDLKSRQRVLTELVKDDPEYQEKLDLVEFELANPKNYKRGMSIIERFHRTLWEKFGRLQHIKEVETKKINREWVNHIQEFIYSYNNDSIHSTLGMTPKEKWDKWERGEEKYELKTHKNVKNKYSIGDMVYVISKDHLVMNTKYRIGSKGFGHESYPITGINYRTGIPKYTVGSNSYYEEELSPAE